MAENDAPEREFDHFSIVPFKAICGADSVGQTTSQTPERVKCAICWRYWKEWDSSRDLAAPDAAQVGKLLDAWELLPNDVKSDLKNEFPSFTDSITSLFRPADDDAVRQAQRETWLPIETAPKDGTDIFLWIPDGREVPIAGRWEPLVVSRKVKWVVDGGMLEDRFLLPTHWMPLPKPPVEAAALRAEGKKGNG